MSRAADKSDDQIFNELNLETYDILMRFLFIIFVLFFNFSFNLCFTKQPRLWLDPEGLDQKFDRWLAKLFEYDHVESNYFQ